MTEDDAGPRRTRKRLRDFKLGLGTSKTNPIHVVVGAEGVLGADQVGQPAHSLNRWLAERFNHNFDEYDRAIDSVYNATHVGGSGFHHLLDGRHDLWGAFESVHEVGDQSWLHDMGQALEHLARDTMSVSGINPFFSMTPEQFEVLGGIVASAGITKHYLYDALTVNGAELLGGSIALVSSLLMAKKAAPERISRLSGGCLLSAAVSANPLLMMVAAGGMVYAISQAEDRRAVFVQAGKGAIVSGSTLLIASLVGGPAWLGCAAALMAGVAISKSIDDPHKAFERARAVVAPAARVFQDVAARLRQLPSESLTWNPAT